MLETTQFLIFEISPKCNLSHAHRECPSAVRTGGARLLTDEQIIMFMEEARRDFHFTGLVGWHYYNEPMLEYKRIMDIMDMYEGRYVLWTNGTVQPEGARMDMFEQIYVTDYGMNINRDYYRGCDNVKIRKARFDSRLLDTSGNSGNGKPCHRQHVEMIIDAWGNGHLCCQDWRGDVHLGNVFHGSFAEIVENRYRILSDMRAGMYPERCRKCRNKIGLANFDKAIHERTMKWLNSAS